MFDPLIDRENRDVTSPAQPAAVEQALQGSEHSRRPVGRSMNAIHEVRPRNMEAILEDCSALVFEQAAVVSQDRLDAPEFRACAFYSVDDWSHGVTPKTAILPLEKDNECKANYSSTSRAVCGEL